MKKLTKEEARLAKRLATDWLIETRLKYLGARLPETTPESLQGLLGRSGLLAELDKDAKERISRAAHSCVRELITKRQWVLNEILRVLDGA